MINDVISDMIIRINNAYKIQHEIVEIPYSKLIKSVVDTLKKENIIHDVKIFKKQFKLRLIKKSIKVILIILKYTSVKHNPLFKQIVRVSKPGLRIFCNKKTIPNILNNSGLAIISSSKGIITNREAKELNIGGEILFFIL
jgi:small subunit ribosomal protein S8